MRYPEFIKKGNTVAFVAPAFGCSVEPYKSSFENFIKKLDEMGYHTLLGPNCYKDDGIGISTSPEDCAKELTDYYTSSDSDAIMSCGGGELMCETISLVDFDSIKEARPKWYMGYSDNTNFIFLLTTLCDVAGIYGPSAPKFGMEPWHKSLGDTWEVLNGKRLLVHNYDKWEKESIKDEENPLAPLNCTEQTVMTGFVPKENGLAKSDDVRMSGRLVGGCMDCLVGITGTRFDKVGCFIDKYKEDGFIWFLESCDLNVFSIRRAMWQMYEAGWFRYCKGMLIGRPLHFDEPMFGLDRFEAILNTARKLNIPVIMDTDIGHLSPMMPLISGSMADITFKDNSLNIEMRLV